MSDVVANNANNMFYIFTEFSDFSIDKKEESVHKVLNLLENGFDLSTVSNTLSLNTLLELALNIDSEICKGSFLSMLDKFLKCQAFKLISDVTNHNSILMIKFCESARNDDDYSSRCFAAIHRLASRYA